MMKMHKALRSLASGYTLFLMYASSIAAVLTPVYMIFGKRPQIIVLLSVCGLCSLFNALLGTSLIYPVSGSTPAISRTMKWAANNRNIFGGSGSCYDMACLFPTTRKKLIMPHIRVWFPLIIIIAAEAAAAVIFNYGGECRVVISVFSVCFALMVTGVPCVFHYNPKNNLPGIVFIVAAWIVLFSVLMIVAVIGEAIGIALPATAAILLPIGAVVVNVIFYYKTALRGDFARNGERVG
ncbi:MAG: hypothetical protein ACI4RH_08545 [Huintestinicola sp.]